MKRRNGKNNCFTGGAFVFLGAGIITVCIFPSEWMIVIAALGMICAGVALLKR